MSEAAPQPSPPLTDVYVAFAGSIDQVGVQKLIRHAHEAQGVGVQRVHMLFHSSGGTGADGICLYNFFRALPFELILYNTGQVSSAAVWAYLGAVQRKTSTYATFILHRAYFNVQGATADRTQAMTKGLIIEDQRTEALMRQHLRLSEDQWKIHSVTDLYLSAQDAVEIGLATEIAEFAPPMGTRVFSVF